ncbi:MAG: substrate-binding domain-containing protein [Clostridiales bacterium]|nr:substrate-binding domain-containing protein [Clostridiales bacterium]
MITIKEIAKLAGTSRGTVDRVLHGRGNVNPKLEKRILQIAREHNYQSNPFAKALVRGGQKYRIGVAINSIGNPFFDDVLAGIRETAEKYANYGIEVDIEEFKGYEEAQQLEALRALLDRAPDALAITPFDTPKIAQTLSTLAPLPIITLNSDIYISEKLAFIGPDYVNSGNLSADMVHMLLPQGGTVCIVTGSFKMLGHNQRIKGFREVLSQRKDIRIVAIEENNDDDDISYQVVSQMMASHQPDLFYFCAAGTQGGVQAVLDLEKSPHMIVVDDIAPMRRLLAEGCIKAIITQQPYRQGALMIETFFNYLIYGSRPEQVNNFMENQVKLRHAK